MKILVNGSPMGEKGNTAIITQAFLEGAVEAGAEAETIYLKDKKIDHCSGCFACWGQTPGVCVHKDDMPALLEQFLKSELVIYASPLYIYTWTGLIKDFMDRLLPLAQPFVDIDEKGLCTHPSRYPEAAKRSVMLISNSGFPEQAHFTGLKATMNCWVRGGNRRMAGAICCAGGVLLGNPVMREASAWYLDAARQAGREIVNTGSISEETQSILDRPLTNNQARFCSMANAYWRSLGIERIGEEPKQENPAVSCGTPLPAPSELKTVQDLIAAMPLAFDAEASGDTHAVVQFIVADEIPGKYCLDIRGSDCRAFAGEHPSPTMTISTPAEVWLGISQGKISGVTAFMEGKYTVEGDMALLMQFEKLFPKRA